MKFQQISPNEGQHIQWLKRYQGDNKDEDISLKSVNNVNKLDF